MTRIPTQAKQNTSFSIQRVAISIIRSEIFIISLVLIGAITFFYRDVVFGGHTFLIEGANDRTVEGVPTFYSRPYLYNGPTTPSVLDAVGVSREIEPWDRFAAMAYQSGQIPWWNPHQGLGIPLHANGDNAIFDPIHWLVYLAPPNLWPLAMDFHLLVRYFLAGLFTYLFSRALHIHIFGALTAALIFMFSSHFTFYGNISFVRVETLLPLVMYAYHRLATRRTFSAVLLTAGSVYLMVVADFPELLILLIGVGLLWYLTQCLLIVGVSKRKPQLFISMLSLAFVATLTGFLLGAHVLLPFAQFLTRGAHLHSASDMASFMGQWPKLQMLGYLIPVTPVQTKIGSVAVILALVSMLIGYRNRKEVWVKVLFTYAVGFLIFALFLNFVAYRVSVFELVDRLPLLNMIFLYRYAQAPIVFCIACAAGTGLELLLVIKLTNRLQMLIFASLVMGIALIVALALASRNTVVVLSQVLIFLAIQISLILLLFSVIWQIKKAKNRIPIAGTVVVLLVFVELITFNSMLSERPLRGDPYVASPYVTFLQHISKPYRIIGTDGILDPNIADVYSIDDIRYEDAITPSVWNDFRRQFLEIPDLSKIVNGFRLEDFSRFNTVIAPPLFNHAMDMLNVQYVLTTSPIPPISAYADTKQFDQIYYSSGVYIYRNNNAFPRAYVVHIAEIITGEQAIFDRFASKDYDPSSTVILDEAPPLAFMRTLPTESTPYQPATVTAENVNDTTVQANLDKPGFLVLSELAYPGWEATVDGQAAKIYNAYGFMRAVPLPAGSHIIVFSYRPTLFFVGLGAALTTLLALIIAGVIPHLRRKRTIHRI